MKRVNSESNAKRWSSESHVSLLGHGRVATEFAESKQGLSIAESCASSTTVKQTLDITINGRAMHLTAEETEPGRAQLTVTTDKGEYTDDGFSGLYDDGADGMARMLWESLCPLDEAEKYPTFRAWCDYMDHMGDDFSPRDMETYNRWRDGLEQWHEATGGMECDPVLTYLDTHFSI